MAAILTGAGPERNPVEQPTTIGVVTELVWRDLREQDREAVATLIRRCHAADGGLPLPLCLQLTEPRFAQGRRIGAFAGAELMAAAAVGDADGSVAAAGMVLPTARGCGLGARLLDWTLRHAGERSVTVASESVTAPAQALYARHGFVPVVEEAVMCCELPFEPPAAPELSPGIRLMSWSPSSAASFYAAYVAAFSERPGFPSWTQREWIEWTIDDDDFRGELSAVALGADGRPLGFVTVGADWIVQLGVVPDQRGRGLGGALVAAALHGIGNAGFRQCWLTVATNNPGARQLYERTGFAQVGLRGRYRREPSSTAL
jgi:mycothiol synthase